MTEIAKTYDPKQVEAKWYSHWEQRGYFSPPPTRQGESFTIVIPPPNVTDRLHVGHALDNTLQDVIIRMKRMQGFDTLWLPGTDHAGIATQNVVERNLQKAQVFPGMILAEKSSLTKCGSGKNSTARRSSSS